MKFCFFVENGYIDTWGDESSKSEVDIEPGGRDLDAWGDKSTLDSAVDSEPGGDQDDIVLILIPKSKQPPLDAASC